MQTITSTPITTPSASNGAPTKSTRRKMLLFLSGSLLVGATTAFTASFTHKLPSASSFKTSQGAVLLKLKTSAKIPSVYLGRTEVSREQFRAFLEATGRSPERVLELSNPDRSKFPVTLNYLEAMSYVSWLTQRDHELGILPRSWKYDLPSDAEWTLANSSVSDDLSLTPKAREGNSTQSIYVWGTMETEAPTTINLQRLADDPALKVGLPGPGDGAAGLTPVEHSDINSAGYVGMRGSLSELTSTPYEGGNTWDSDCSAITVRGPNYTTSKLDDCRLSKRWSVKRDMSGTSAALASVVGFRIAAREITSTLSVP